MSPLVNPRLCSLYSFIVASRKHSVSSALRIRRWISKAVARSQLTAPTGFGLRILTWSYRSAPIPIIYGDIGNTASCQPSRRPLPFSSSPVRSFCFSSSLSSSLYPPGPKPLPASRGDKSGEVSPWMPAPTTSSALGGESGPSFTGGRRSGGICCGTRREVGLGNGPCSGDVGALQFRSAEDEGRSLSRYLSTRSITVRSATTSRGVWPKESFRRRARVHSMNKRAIRRRKRRGSRKRRGTTTTTHHHGRPTFKGPRYSSFSNRGV